jgi:hypothetical protein
MTKAKSEKFIRYLVREWAIETGVQRDAFEMPVFSDFQRWLNEHGYGHYLNFRSTMGPEAEAKLWFDQELGQAWRN